MIKIHNLTKYYNNISNPILNKINLTIPSNSIIGLAGPSGSGKSTLLRCIQKLEKYDSGIIDYSGTCGFMFQDFQLFPHMNVLDNLIYAPKTKNKNNNYIEKALSLLKQLGIENKKDVYPSKLSGGQKQRVALARSLMLDPKLLLCDEPISGLDFFSIKEVFNLLKNVNKQGVTIIIASHDLNFLSEISNKIVFIDNGVINENFQNNADKKITNYL